MSPAVIAVAVFVGFALVVVVISQFVGRGDRFGDRLAQVVDGAVEIDEAEIAEITGRPPERTERLPGLTKFLKGRAWTEAIDRRLTAAGLPLKAAEYAAIWAASVVGLVLIPLVLHAPIVVVAGLGFVGLYVPNFLLNYLHNKRKLTLEGQLADALTMMASGLRAGYTVLQGMQAAADQLPDPIASEYRRVAKLVNVGMDLGAALRRMGTRVQSYDFDIMITAVNIQLTTGGNLAGLLETIANTIRERITLRREIAAATAQGKLSGMILIGLPVLIALGLMVINRPYFDKLFTPMGKWLIGMAGCQQVIGIWIIKRLLNFDA